MIATTCFRAQALDVVGLLTLPEVASAFVAILNYDPGDRLTNGRCPVTRNLLQYERVHLVAPCTMRERVFETCKSTEGTKSSRRFFAKYSRTAREEFN